MIPGDVLNLLLRYLIVGWLQAFGLEPPSGLHWCCEHKVEELFSRPNAVAELARFSGRSSFVPRKMQGCASGCEIVVLAVLGLVAFSDGWEKAIQQNNP
jgi:hypothetical protein